MVRARDVHKLVIIIAKALPWHALPSDALHGYQLLALM